MRENLDVLLFLFLSSKNHKCVRPHTTRVFCSDVFHSSIELILKNPGKVTQAIKAAPAATRAPKSAYNRACHDLPPSAGIAPFSLYQLALISHLCLVDSSVVLKHSTQDLFNL